MKPARAVMAALLMAGPATVMVVAKETEVLATAGMANPIRKVVDMLQMMTKKVEAEGEKEKELYEKFMCWCKSGGDEIDKAITDANKRIPELESLIAELEALLAKLKLDIEQHKKDRDAIKASIEAAAEIRKKEAAAAAKASVNNQVYILALEKAIAALEKGTYGAFLQTNSAAVLTRLVQSDSGLTVKLGEADRQDLMAFLDAPAYGNEYVPQSQEIIGILKQMLDDFKASEHDGTAGEKKAIIEYKLMIKALLKQLDALNKLIEDKLARIGEISVKIQMYKNDLGDTEASLDDNTKFFGDLKKDCATKTAEYEERCKMRAMELAALADTIKVLNDDDSLDLFKKTLPSASLLQVEVRLSELRRRALSSIRSLARSVGVQSRPQLDFIALALSGKKIGFGKIIKMIDNMIANLHQEQADDDGKMEYCTAQLDTADDKKKALERTVSDLESQIASLKEAIITVTGEIDALEDGIRALDKSVAEATENRKEEHEEYAELMASDGAAKELILYAKNRMQKF